MASKPRARDRAKAFQPARMPARRIPVDDWRGMVFWPLTLDLPPRELDKAPARRSDAAGGLKPMHQLVSDQIGHLSPVWDEVRDTLDHLPRPGPDKPDAQAKHDREAYAEYTYFHDFIQRFQFSQHGGDPSREPFRLFRRTDITGLDLTLAGGQDKDRNRLIALKVERLNLYVYSCGVAILAIELAAGGDAAIREIAGLADADGKGRKRGLTLADVLDLNDRVRRAHAPFLLPGMAANGHGPCGDTTPGLMPLRHAWRDAAGREIKAFASDDDLMLSGEPPQPIRLRLRGMKKHEREIPPLAALRWLVEPEEKGEKGWAIAPGMSKGISWRHVSDERLPLLATVQLRDQKAYHDIDEGNWYRLAFVDGEGDHRLPFAGAFLRERFADHAYDRYHYPAPAPDEEPESKNAPARYLMTGYSMLAVGCDGFFRDYIAMHMRRHYFQIMLLAQFEMAAMLSFSSRITLAISDYEEAGRADETGLGTSAIRGLEDDLQQIEQDFLHFVHRYRFTGISSQIQPTEMFEKLRKVMRLDAIFSDLKEELTTANDFLFRRADQRSTAAAERLNVIATIGVVAGLALSLLSMQVLVNPDLLDKLGILPKTRSIAEHAGFVLGVFAIVIAGGLGIMHWLRDGMSEGGAMAGKLKTLLERALLICLCGGLVLYGLGRAHRPPAQEDPQEVQLCEIRDGKRWCTVKGFGTDEKP